MLHYQFYLCISFLLKVFILRIYCQSVIDSLGKGSVLFREQIENFLMQLCLCAAAHQDHNKKVKEHKTIFLWSD